MPNTNATYPGTASTEAVAPEDGQEWGSVDRIKTADGLGTYTLAPLHVSQISFHI